MSAQNVHFPNLFWAQDKTHVFCTIAVADLTSADVKFEENSFSFKGTKASRSEDTQYELGFELSAPIDPDNSKWTLGARNVQLVLAKKESGVFWAHLPKDNKKWKPHVQIDWDKWVDEDEEEESPAASGDMGDMSQLMGGAGGGGMDLQSMLANMKGGEVGEQAEEDSDDEEMPELEAADMAQTVQ